MLLLIHAEVIIFEIIGLLYSIEIHGIALFFFYTQDSNLLALVTSILFLVCLSQKIYPRWLELLRYMSVCCLSLTFLVSALILAPTGGGYMDTFFQGSKLYHHLLCPALMFVSYCFLEEHPVTLRRDRLLSMLPTVIYAAILILLNVLKIVNGPYLFFLVYNQSVMMSMIWCVIILSIAYLTCWGVQKISELVLTIRPKNRFAE